ncbi:MAG: hypothetical protein LBJ95_01980 [Oscillospiraceae bacterium]|jgi:hypothetical protein|nr:hypothetical protein [Oscillospiraceae bacterium]
MKKLLSTFLGAIISLSSTASFFTFHASAHSGNRTLAAEQAGDSSSWYELFTKCGDDFMPYSLIVRKTAVGKSDASNYQAIIDLWFAILPNNSRLKRLAVRSNANLRPGFHGESAFESDYIDGISGPTPDNNTGILYSLLSEPEIKFFLDDSWLPESQNGERVFGFHTRTPGTAADTRVIQSYRGEFLEIPAQSRHYHIVPAMWVNSSIFD